MNHRSDDADDEELASWNFAKDLEGQVKALKAEIKEMLVPVKDLKKALKAKQKPVKTAEKLIKQLTGSGPKSIVRAEKKGLPTESLHEELNKQQEALAAAIAETSQFEQRIFNIEASIKPHQDEIERIRTELVPYEQIKTDLATTRAAFRALTNAFVDELKKRCAAFSTDEKQALVLELFAQDLKAGLNDMVRDKQQELVRFVENLWDKYASSLTVLTTGRERLSSQLHNELQELGYAN